MDEIDRKIIDILKRNSRTAITKIAEKVGLTEGAVRYRISELLKNGEIKRFTIDTKEEIDAIVLISTKPEIKTEVVSEAIREIPNVTSVYEVSGDYDIISMVKRRSMRDMNDTVEKIRAVKGVLETITCMILRKS
ncbi:MAG: AsnC family transcriptional regulator [Candidatus Aenigmarchaeota archaeon]|nr:AsnC family transcriptional regulator [Candidatus Aenigmarchaeota archaeon]